MKFLTSMMLLGLTKAQLDVYRAKAFTIGTLTPLDRLLNLGSLATDNLVLEVKCDDNTNKREFWYNDVTSDTIGKPICPSYYCENEDDENADQDNVCDPSGYGSGSLELATDQHLDERFGLCPEQLGSYPDVNLISNEYTQEGGSLICDSHADVEFKLYK
jgi:hypothetical protein